MNDPIGDRPRHDARMVMGNEAVRGLFIINGGGAVALLAFLEKIWDTDKILAIVVLAGMSFFLLGIVLAATVNFVRIASSLAHNYGAKNSAQLAQLHRSRSNQSIACFVIACAILIVGAFAHLIACH